MRGAGGLSRDPQGPSLLSPVLLPPAVPAARTPYGACATAREVRPHGRRARARSHRWPAWIERGSDHLMPRCRGSGPACGPGRAGYDAGRAGYDGGSRIEERNGRSPASLPRPPLARRPPPAADRLRQSDRPCPANSRVDALRRVLVRSPESEARAAMAVKLATSWEPSVNTGVGPSGSAPAFLWRRRSFSPGVPLALAFRQPRRRIPA